MASHKLRSAQPEGKNEGRHNKRVDHAHERERRKHKRHDKHIDKTGQNREQIGFSGTIIDSQAPIIVCDCITFLREKGLFFEGIFRIPGSNEKVKKLMREYDSRYRTQQMKDTEKYDILNNFPEEPYVQDVTSLLKKYLTQLKEPLIPKQSTLALLEVVTERRSERSQVRAISEVLASMQSPNRECLAFIISFLREVATFSFQNQMGGENLGKCFVLSMMRPADDIGVDQLTLLGRGARVLEIMIMKPVKLTMPLLFTVLQNTRFDPENLRDRTPTNDPNDGEAITNNRIADTNTNKNLDNIKRDLQKDLKNGETLPGGLKSAVKRRPSLLGLPKFSKIPSLPSLFHRNESDSNNRKHVNVKPAEAFKVKSIPSFPHVDSVQVDKESAQKLWAMIKDNSVTNSPRMRADQRIRGPPPRPATRSNVFNRQKPSGNNNKTKNDSNDTSPMSARDSLDEIFTLGHEI